MGREKMQRPIDVRTGADPDVLMDTFRVGVTTSTAPSTALAARGAVSLESTSTGAPVVYTLEAPAEGDFLAFNVQSVGSSSDAPFHINAGSGVFFSASTNDMVTLSSAGAGITLIGRSSSQWMPVGEVDATLSTST